MGMLMSYCDVQMPWFRLSLHCVEKFCNIVLLSANNFLIMNVVLQPGKFDKLG